MRLKENKSHRPSRKLGGNYFIKLPQSEVSKMRLILFEGRQFSSTEHDIYRIKNDIYPHNSYTTEGIFIFMCVTQLQIRKVINSILVLSETFLCFNEVNEWLMKNLLGFIQLWSSLHWIKVSRVNEGLSIWNEPP